MYIEIKFYDLRLHNLNSQYKYLNLLCIQQEQVQKG